MCYDEYCERYVEWRRVKEQFDWGSWKASILKFQGGEDVTIIINSDASIEYFLVRLAEEPWLQAGSLSDFRQF